jgi:hypothetical protein
LSWFSTGNVLFCNQLTPRSRDALILTNNGIGEFHHANMRAKCDRAHGAQDAALK